MGKYLQEGNIEASILQFTMFKIVLKFGTHVLNKCVRFTDFSTPFRPPSQSLKLSSSSAAFCNSTSRTSPQHLNATMPEKSEKTEIQSATHNTTTGGLTNGSSSLSQTIKAKGECAKDMEADPNNQLRLASLGTVNLVQPVYKKNNA